MGKVSEVLDAAAGLRQTILTGLHQAPAQGERIVLVASYLDTVIEHHESIVLLVRNEKYGSAFALLRPVYESVLRACWVNACATDAQVRDLRSIDEHHKIFPPSAALFAQLDSAYGLNEQLQKLRDKWEAMCSYTHSGLRQLARRGFRGARQHGYSPRAVIEVVDFATSGLASLARVYFAATDTALWILAVSAVEKDYYEAGKSNKKETSVQDSDGI